MSIKGAAFSPPDKQIDNSPECRSSNNKAQLGYCLTPNTPALPQKVVHTHQWDSAAYQFGSSSEFVQTHPDV